MGSEMCIRDRSISGGSATLSSATPTSISASGNVYTLGLGMSGTPNGSETLTVVPVDNGIYDAAGNEASTSQSNNSVTLYDQTIPIVSTVTATTANGIYTVNNTIAITITFTEAVTVSGTPQLTLETGSSDAVVNYASGSGSSTLIFNYTVASGHTNADLDYVSASSLALNGGTIVDAISYAATLTLPTPGATNSLAANKALVIDQLFPNITGSVLATNNASIAVTFNEAVFNTANTTGALEACLLYTSPSPRDS